MFAGPPPGRFCGEGARFRKILSRSPGIRRTRHLPGAIGRNFASRGSVGDFVESSENFEKPPLFADSPPGRFCGEGARIMEMPTQSAEIRQNRHLIWARGGNIVSLGSVVACVECSGNPEKHPRLADHPPGRCCGLGRAPRKFPPDQPRFGEMAAYLGRPGAMLHLADHRPIV